MRGLPEMRRDAGDLHAGRVLAPGETVLWEGRPSTLGLALRAFHLPVVATYFAVLTTLGLVGWLQDRVAALTVVMPFVTGLLTAAILFGLAAATARTTRYIVTGDRIILRYGIALPRCLSIPLRQIATLSLAPDRGDRGDVALGLKAGNHMPWTKLWPHARPWRLRRPEPMLRDVRGAALLATQLSRRLADEQRERAAAERQQDVSERPRVAA